MVINHRISTRYHIMRERGKSLFILQLSPCFASCSICRSLGHLRPSSLQGTFQSLCLLPPSYQKGYLFPLIIVLLKLAESCFPNAVARAVESMESKSLIWKLLLSSPIGLYSLRFDSSPVFTRSERPFLEVMELFAFKLCRGFISRND